MSIIQRPYTHRALTSQPLFSLNNNMLSIHTATSSLSRSNIKKPILSSTNSFLEQKHYLVFHIFHKKNFKSSKQHYNNSNKRLHNSRKQLNSVSNRHNDKNHKGREDTHSIIGLNPNLKMASFESLDGKLHLDKFQRNEVLQDGKQRGERI